MGLSLKQQADTVASAETARFEAKEAEIKKASQKAGDVEAPTPDKGKGNSSSNSSSSSSSKAKKTKKDPEARARRKELSKVKSTLGRLQRRVDGFWYSKFPFAGASGFRKRVLLRLRAWSCPWCVLFFWGVRPQMTCLKLKTCFNRVPGRRTH
ncbi:unnamed protein product, partial [Ectocarpus sp. 12 AP-2014]